MLDHFDEALVELPVERPARIVVVSGSDTLLGVRLGDADEREDFVYVGEPEDTRLDDIFSLELLYLQQKPSSICSLLTITYAWTVCMTFAKNRSLSGIIPNFHISLLIRLMR